MNPKTRISMVFMTFLLALALSAMWTIPVLADDGTPPPTDAPAVTDASSEASPAQEAPPEASPAQQDTPAEAPPAQQDTPSEAPAAEAAPTDPAPGEAPAAEAAPTDPAPGEAPVVEAAPTDSAPGEAPVVEAAPTDPAPSEVPAVEAAPTEPASVDTGSTETNTDAPALPADLSQVPTGTDVVVLDATGTVVSMASTEAAQIVATGDPIWCPSSVVTPVNGGSGCSSSFSSFKEVVDWLTANPKTVAGTIWIAKEYDSSVNDLPGTVNFMLDGNLLGTTASFALTLKGGWNGLGTGTVNTADPSVFNGDSLSILNWKADITLNDILITGVTSGTALQVTTTKNISLMRVEVSTNAGSGADLNNSGGTGKVDVTSSKFKTNTGGDGLSVISKGIITLNSITANDNGSRGAYLDNQWSGAVGGININGTSEFARNSGTGLTAFSKGSITLANLDAYENGNNGVYLDNNVAGTSGSVSVGTTLAGWYNALEDNGNNGLVIYSRGAITLLNIGASGNAYNGAFIDNRNAATPMSVTITKSTFNGNGAYDDGAVSQRGLEVYSKGAITLTEIDANDNRNGDLDGNDIGVYLNNTFGTAGVTMSGTNFIYNNERGLSIYTNGAVLLNNLVSNGNDSGSGAYVDNSTASTAQPVTLTGSSEFKFNSSGLVIFTKGLITLNNITATYNQGTCAGCGGAYLNNLASPVSTSAGITLTGLNTFNNNSMTGLQVYTTGMVTLNNITASNNGWYDSVGDAYHGNGAYIDNTYATTPKTVSLLGTNNFISNATTGLVVYSKGTITVNNVYAGYNGWVDPADADPTDGSPWGNGAYLDNCLSQVDDNGTPLDDSDDIYYCTTPMTSSITLTGTNTFNGNGRGTGLYTESLGIISVSNLTANNNGGSGAVLDNNWDYWDTVSHTYKLPFSAVTVSGYGKASNNGNRGISVFSTGAVTMSKLTANNNNSNGVYISNDAVPNTPKTVSLIDTSNTFNGNGDTGLNIFSYGAVSLNNLTANNNGHYDVGLDQYFGYGVYVDNSGATLAQAVSITGSNTFQNNRLSGLEVYSKGAISANNLNSKWNGSYDIANDLDYTDGSVYGYGAKLDNCRRDDNGTPGNPDDDFCSIASTAAITVTGTNYFDGNWNSGLHVESRGAITVNNLTSQWNGQENGFNNNADPDDLNDANGAYLDNMWPGASGGITILGYSKTEGNMERGLEIYSKGIVSLINLTANNNWYTGVRIDNDASAATSQSLTISGTNSFNNNSSTGLEIHSYGAITLSNINANRNGGPYNASIDNCGYDTTGCTAITQSPVSLTGNNSFDGNWNGGNGLSLQSFGNITVSNLSASNNNGYGAYLDNQLVNQAATPVPSAGTITITGYANFNGNGLHGVDAWSNGNITIANLNANRNTGSTMAGNDVGGAYLDAYKSGTGVANVVLTGFNNLNENSFGNGLTVYADGTITIANLSANQNSENGAYLDNRDYGSATSPQAVTLSGNNSFWHNYFDGLDAFSYGAVTINNIDASDNGISNNWSTVAGPEYGWGVYIKNTNPNALYAKPVTFTGVNTFNGNYNSGLEILSSGAVSLPNITANRNGYYYDSLYSYTGPDNTYVGCGQTINNLASDFSVGCGTYIDNSSASTPLGVTLSGTFENNTLNGLKVISDGLINLNNISANNNGEGAYLYSNLKGVTLTGTNTFDGNWGDGLYVDSFEAIAIANLEANNNHGRGAFLYNQYGLKHANVTITGFASTESNGNDGLRILTNGTVSLINVNASWNGGVGTYIDATDDLTSAQGGSAANVSILGTNNFSGNSATGLVVFSDGVITANNITANWNSGNGAYLDNITNGWWTPLPAVRLNLTGINVFNGNGINGLQLNAYGNVSMTKVTADNNSGNGVLGNTTNGNIALACGSMNRNSGGYGYDLTASGSITLSGIYGYGNFNMPGRAIAPTVTVVRTCPLP